MISKCVRKNKNGTARVAERQMRKPLSGKPLPFIIQVIKLMGFYKRLLRHFTDLVNWALWIDVDLLWFCLWKHEKCLIQFDISLQSWSLGMLAFLTIYTITSGEQGECVLSSRAFCLVIIFCILLTLMSDSAVKLFGKVWG